MNQNKCKGCGSYLIFSPENQILKCTHCENSKKIDNLIPSQNLVKSYSENYSITPKEDESRHYECTSCGNIMIIDDETRKRCPSCGDKALAPKRQGVFIPDGTIPFAISSIQAKTHFSNWIKKRIFAPNNLKKLAKLGKISGMYSPAWSYNFSMIGSYSGQVSWREQVSKDKYRTRTKLVSGKINENFEDVLTTGNNQISSETLNNSAPYNCETSVNYDSRLLLGFSGLDTNINPHTAHEEMIKTTTKQIERQLRLELGSGKYSVDYLNVSVKPTNEKLKYLFLPIYASHYTYKNKKYHTYINGQNGTTTGTYPKSFWKIFFFILGIITAILGLGALIASAT